MSIMKCYPYRYTRVGAYTKALVLVNGRAVEPKYTRYSKTGRHGEECWDESTIESADVILVIDISNSGKHYCYIIIQKPNMKSIKKALEIHECESIWSKLGVSK